MYSSSTTLIPIPITSPSCSLLTSLAFPSSYNRSVFHVSSPKRFSSSFLQYNNIPPLCTLSCQYWSLYPPPPLQYSSTLSSLHYSSLCPQHFSIPPTLSTPRQNSPFASPTTMSVFHTPPHNPTPTSAPPTLTHSTLHLPSLPCKQ